MKIRKGDEVKVIAGADKGKVGKVKEAIPSEDKVIVEGVGLVRKHLRPSAKNQKGGRLSKEMPVHVSNVMLVSKDGKPARVGARFTSDGQKERYCKRTGASLGVIGSRKAARAQESPAPSAKSSGS